MLELHYFLLGVLILLSLAYFYNEMEMKKDLMMENFDTGRDELKSVIVGKNDAFKGGEGACRPFKYGRLIALDDPNIPLDKQTDFQTEVNSSGGNGGKLDDDIVSHKGSVNFGIKKFLFDGIWDRTCDQEGLDRVCKWKMTKGGKSEWTSGWNRHSVPKNCGEAPMEGKYSTDNFFHFPEKCMPIDGEIYIGDQCEGLLNKDDDVKRMCCYEDCDDTVVQA